MVLFRGKDGVAYALEAYCLHMGAHLGVGGQVVDEKCIECPFHGWLYDGATGHCVGTYFMTKTMTANLSFSNQSNTSRIPVREASCLGNRSQLKRQLSGNIPYVRKTVTSTSGSTQLGNTNRNLIFRW